LGEFIEELFVELIGGAGAVRQALVRHVG